MSESVINAKAMVIGALARDISIDYSDCEHRLSLMCELAREIRRDDWAKLIQINWMYICAGVQYFKQWKGPCTTVTSTDLYLAGRTEHIFKHPDHVITVDEDKPFKLSYTLYAYGIPRLPLFY